jgi:hypothetical protein
VGLAAGTDEGADCEEPWEGALLRSQADKSNSPLDVFIHYAFDVLLKKASG